MTYLPVDSSQQPCNLNEFAVFWILSAASYTQRNEHKHLAKLGEHPLSVY